MKILINQQRVMWFVITLSLTLLNIWLFPYVTGDTNSLKSALGVFFLTVEGLVLIGILSVLIMDIHYDDIELFEPFTITLSLFRKRDHRRDEEIHKLVQELLECGDDINRSNKIADKINGILERK